MSARQKRQKYGLVNSSKSARMREGIGRFSEGGAKLQSDMGHPKPCTKKTQTTLCTTNYLKSMTEPMAKNYNS